MRVVKAYHWKKRTLKWKKNNTCTFNFTLNIFSWGQFCFHAFLFFSNVEIMQILNIIVILSIHVYCSGGVTAKNNDNDTFILNLTMKDYESSEVSRHVLFVNKWRWNLNWNRWMKLFIWHIKYPMKNGSWVRNYFNESKYICFCNLSWISTISWNEYSSSYGYICVWNTSFSTIFLVCVLFEIVVVVIFIVRL